MLSDLHRPPSITGAGEQPPPDGERSAPETASVVSVSAETISPGGRELISRRAFGRLKGWAPSYIVKLVHQGVLSVFSRCASCGSEVNSRSERCEHCGALTTAVNWKRGGIDPALAELELRRARDPGKDATRERWAEHRAGGSEAGPGRLVAEGPRDQASGGEMENEPDLLGAGADGAVIDLERATFAQARAHRERTEARLKELQLQEQLGNLVRADLVRQEQMRAARRVRDGVMAVPGHICYELAAESDPARVLIKLESELGAALRMIGEQLEGDAEASGS